MKLFTSASSQNFFNGCAAHYLADKKFHASEFFRNILQQSSLIINQAKFNSDLNRKWFLAHILAELMLDRILVRMYPEMLHKFYNSLDSINDSDLAYYLTLYGMKDVEEFFEFFNHFRKVQYIYYYTDNNKFVYSLNRIMIKAGVTPISDFNQEVLCNAALLLEENLIEDTSSLIINLKQSIQ